MKSAQTLILSLAAVALAGSCQSMTKQTPNPRSSSNWNAGHVGESASYAFFGANSLTPDTIRLYTRDESVSISLTMRRYLFNDNPENPLQEHRYTPDQRYIPIWHTPVYAVGNVWDITRSTGVNAWNGTMGLLVMPWQLVAGADQNTGVTSPPSPEDFKVKNK